MQTSKLLLVMGAVTMLTGVSIPGANETEAQKKAREALRQKWQELDAQSQPAAPSAPAAPKPPPAAPSRAVAPATPPPAAQVPAPAVRAADTDAQAKAREALRQKYNEGQFPQPGAPATPPSAPVQRSTPPAAKASTS